MPSVGDRVRVAFAGNGKGREYIGIVSGTDIEPEIAEDRIKDIVGIEQGLVRISEQEIALWRTVADYYMCSIGEVYKAAYPAQKIQGEEVQARMEARAQKKTEQEEAKRKREEEKREREKAREEEKIQKKRERLEKKGSRRNCGKPENADWKCLCWKHGSRKHRGHGQQHHRRHIISGHTGNDRQDIH